MRFALLMIIALCGCERAWGAAAGRVLNGGSTNVVLRHKEVGGSFSVVSPGNYFDISTFSYNPGNQATVESALGCPDFTITLGVQTFPSPIVGSVSGCTFTTNGPPPAPSLCWSVGPWVNHTVFEQEVEVRRYGTGAGLLGTLVWGGKVAPGKSINWAVTNACPMWVQVHYTCPPTEADCFDTPGNEGTNGTPGGVTNSVPDTGGPGNVYDPDLNDSTGGPDTPVVNPPPGEPRTNDFGSSIADAIAALNLNQESRHKEHLAQDRARAGADQTNWNTALNLSVHQHSDTVGWLRSIRDSVNNVNESVTGVGAGLSNFFGVITNTTGAAGTNSLNVAGGDGYQSLSGYSDYVELPSIGSDSVLFTIPYGALEIEGLNDADVDFADADFGTVVTYLRGVILLSLTGFALWASFRHFGKIGGM